MLALMPRLLCVLPLVAAAGAPAGAHAAAADPLAVRGGRLVDAHGRAVVLHGVNVAYKPAPYTPDFTRVDGDPFVPTPFPDAYLQRAVGRSFTSFWSNRAGIRSEFVRVLRRTPLTVRGSGSASITVTRR